MTTLEQDLGRPLFFDCVQILGGLEALELLSQIADLLLGFAGGVRALEVGGAIRGLMTGGTFLSYYFDAIALGTDLLELFLQALSLSIWVEVDKRGLTLILVLHLNLSRHQKLRILRVHIRCFYCDWASCRQLFVSILRAYFPAQLKGRASSIWRTLQHEFLLGFQLELRILQG